MRMTIVAAAVSSALLGAAVAQADPAMTKDQFSAADADRDGLITLAEAKTGAPTLAAHFKTVDANSDGRISEEELSTYDKTRDKSMDADQPARTPPPDK